MTSEVEQYWQTFIKEQNLSPERQPAEIYSF